MIEQTFKKTETNDIVKFKYAHINSVNVKLSFQYVRTFCGTVEHFFNLKILATFYFNEILILKLFTNLFD